MKKLWGLGIAVIMALPVMAYGGGLETGFIAFLDDTLDSVIVGDTCAADQGDTILIPVYLRNPVHTIEGFEVRLFCGNPYDPYIINYGYADGETAWIDTTGSCASYFEYFQATGDYNNHTWVKVVGIADMYTQPDTPPPLYPSDTARLLFKVVVVVDSPVISPDTTYDTLAHIHLDFTETRLSDTSGLCLYYPGLRDGHLQIGGWWFTRGDANNDGDVNIVDAAYLLNHFLPVPVFDCLDAADFDDNGSINVVDASFLLSHLLPSPNLPPPNYPNCGVDPTPDNLMCCTYPPCWWFKAENQNSKKEGSSR